MKAPPALECSAGVQVTFYSAVKTRGDWIQPVNIGAGEGMTEARNPVAACEHPGLVSLLTRGRTRPICDSVSDDTEPRAQGLEPDKPGFKSWFCGFLLGPGLDVKFMFSSVKGRKYAQLTELLCSLGFMYIGYLVHRKLSIRLIVIKFLLCARCHLKLI